MSSFTLKHNIAVKDLNEMIPRATPTRKSSAQSPFPQSKLELFSESKIPIRYVSDLPKDWLDGFYRIFCGEIRRQRIAGTADRGIFNYYDKSVVSGYDIPSKLLCRLKGSGSCEGIASSEMVNIDRDRTLFLNAAILGKNGGRRRRTVRPTKRKPTKRKRRS